MLHIFFVCTGNICRSPIAERLAAMYAKEAGLTSFTASSAGTHAAIGHPMHEDAVAVLDKLGGDSTNFAARHLNTRSASPADLLLTMTRVHRDAVLRTAPQKLHRTFTLSEVGCLTSRYGAKHITDLSPLRSLLRGDEAPDILDPIGRSPEYFAQIGAQIAELLPTVIDLCRTY